MNLGVFIDLNCYRFTNDVFDNLMQDLASKNIIDKLIIYNYSPLLHKTFNFPQHARLHNSLSGRRKVMIDIRQVCDMIEYATFNKNCNVYSLNAMVDSAPLFDKLQELKANVTLATPTPIKANVNGYHYLTRSSTFKESHFHIKNILDSENSYSDQVIKNEEHEKPFSNCSGDKIVRLLDKKQADTIENLHPHNDKSKLLPDNHATIIAKSNVDNFHSSNINLKIKDSNEINSNYNNIIGNIKVADLSEIDGMSKIDYSTDNEKLNISAIEVVSKQNMDNIKSYINSVTAKTKEATIIEKKHSSSDYDTKLKELERLISNLYN